MSNFKIAKLPQFKENTKTNKGDIEDYYDNIENAERMKKQRKEYLKTKYEKLFKEYSCQEFIEPKGLFPMECDILINKVIARREEEFSDKKTNFRSIIVHNIGKNLVSRLKCWIPDTIVFNDLENPFWLYSNESGELWRTEKFSSKTICSKLGNFSSSNELVAVLKKGGGPYKTKLLTTKELNSTVHGFASSGSKGMAAMAVQRYIKSIGSKAFKVRTIWSKDRPPVSYVVTNKSGYYEYDGIVDSHKYMTHPTKYGVCTIFKTNKGKQLTDTLPFVQNIVKYIREVLGVTTRNVAADFIKDESGIWWMVNIKSIVLFEEIPTPKMRRITHGEDDNYDDDYVDGERIKRRPDGYQKIKL